MLQSSNCCRWGLAEQLVSLAFHTNEHHFLHSTHFSTPNGTPLEGSNDKNNARRKQNASTLIHLPCECGGERSMYPCVCVCVCVCEGSYRETGIPDAEHSAVRGPLQPIQVAGLCLKVLQTNTDALKPNCTGSMHSP